VAPCFVARANSGRRFDFYPNCRIKRQQDLYKKPGYDPVKLFDERFGEQRPQQDTPKN
jgi:hypothetical protein